MTDRIYTAAQAAEVLQVGISYMYTLLQTGIVTGVKVGRAWRVRQSEIDAYLQDRVLTPDRVGTNTETHYRIDVYYGKKWRAFTTHPTRSEADSNAVECELGRGDQDWRIVRVEETIVSSTKGSNK